MDALWEQILELTSRLLIPEWRELIVLLPLGLAALIVAWLLWTVVRFASVGPARRVPARVAPVAPPGTHMPGGSLAPIAAALGAAVLFLGLVLGGTWLWLGATALVVGLLVWGRDALRDYDQLAPAMPVPNTVRRAPPPGVHLPGPSFRPLLAALGVTALLGGLVVGGWLLAAGALFMFVALLGWLADARAEYAKVELADTSGHLENIPAPGWPRTLVGVFVVVFAVAFLADIGLFPPSAEPGGGVVPSAGASAEPSPGASAGPSAGPTIPPGALEVVARDIAFDRKDLEVAAGQPFVIVLVNQDAPGVPHDIDIRIVDGAVLADQAIVDGGLTAVYEYGPLDAGAYVFICSVHPIPSMTGTLTVK
jgi:plastocyanin